MDQITATGERITIIHLTFWKEEKGKGDWYIACMPGMTTLHKTNHQENHQRSNDARAVSCPACKRTSIYGEIKRRGADLGARG